jgi:hypothetical protein
MSYFKVHGINTTVDFNSTHNVIVGNPYIGYQEWRTIHRQYHDRPATNIHFIIANGADGNMGEADPLLGALINVEFTQSRNLTLKTVMHEIGHCIGIGLQDDSDHNETYPSSGFMSKGSTELYYRAEDWNSSFAPEGSFGNQTWKLARMWNRYSVYGELYDDTADVSGVVTSDIMPVIYLNEIDGSKEYAVNIDNYTLGFSFQPKPGNYTLEVSEGYRLVRPVFVNVTERAIINIGNVAIEIVPVEPVENPEPVKSPQDNRMTYVLVIVLITIILVLALVLRIRKNELDEGQRNWKIIASVAIAVVLLLVPSYFYLGPNDLYDSVTVNEFFDDLNDRNKDGVINFTDEPFAWHSYGPGDRVVVRDRIEIVGFDTDYNRTFIQFPEYSGKYINQGFFQVTYALVPGNVTDTYSVGDIILIENQMTDNMDGFGYWLKNGSWILLE